MWQHVLPQEMFRWNFVGISLKISLQGNYESDIERNFNEIPTIFFVAKGCGNGPLPHPKFRLTPRVFLLFGLWQWSLPHTFATQKIRWNFVQCVANNCYCYEMFNEIPTKFQRTNDHRNVWQFDVAMCFATSFATHFCHMFVCGRIEYTTLTANHGRPTL